MTTQTMTTTEMEILRSWGIEGQGRRSGKWLVWDARLSAAACRKIEAELKAAGVVGFARPGRGAAVSTVGVLA